VRPAWITASLQAGRLLPVGANFRATRSLKNMYAASDCGLPGCLTPVLCVALPASPITRSTSCYS